MNQVGFIDRLIETLGLNDGMAKGKFTPAYYVHPFFLKAKAAASLEDNTNWHKAMNGQFADEYWDAAESEIETL